MSIRSAGSWKHAWAMLLVLGLACSENAPPPPPPPSAPQGPVEAAVQRVQLEILDLELDFEAQDDLADAAGRAIEAIAADSSARGPELDAALEALTRDGDTSKLRAILTARAERADQTPVDQSKAYAALGAVAYADDRDQSIAAYRKAVELDRESLETLRRLGHVLRPHSVYTGGDVPSEEELRLTERLRSSADMYQRLLARAKQSGDRAAQAEANAGLGYVTSRTSDGIPYLEAALPIEQELGRQPRIAHLYRSLAETNLRVRYTPDLPEQQYKDALALAVQQYEDAVEIDQSLGRHAAVAHTYGQLAALYERSRDADELEDTLKTTLSLAQPLGMKRLALKCHLGLVSVYAAREPKPEAIAELDRALALSAEIDPQEAIADRFVEVAERFAGSEQAVRVYEHARGLYEKLGKTERAAALDARIAAAKKSR